MFESGVSSALRIVAIWAQAGSGPPTQPRELRLSFQRLASGTKANATSPPSLQHLGGTPSIPPLAFA